MNISSEHLSEIKKLSENSKSILIIICPNPQTDHIASALSLYLLLSGMGKQTNVICSTEMTVEFSHLIGVDKIEKIINNQSGKNLIVSFPYQEGSIEKVSYNIENDRFNLVIEPREGYNRITAEEINFSYSGSENDLIFTIGVSKISDLGDLYNNNRQLFDKGNLINIDNQSSNNNFGKINLVDNQIPSISEILAGNLSAMGFSMNPDTATNLLAGITAASNNFTSDTTNASTFESAAICLKNGAEKIKSINKETTFQFPPKHQTNQLQQSPSMGSVKPQKTFSFPPNKQGSFSGNQSMKVKIQQPRQQPQNFQQTQQQPQPQKPQHQNDAPADWLKPKIYKGSTLL
jgi:nanoRNase/pAp phosphatase (c-di-AMP/oligoRNAs hydrolase)